VRRCFVIAGAYSATFAVWFLFVPSYLAGVGATSLVSALMSALIGLLAAAVAAPLFGRISDTVGRRPVLIAAAGAMTVIVVPLYLWMLGGSRLATSTGALLVGITLAAFVLPAFLSEQFPTRVRATGLGLAYGIGSAVVGGTAPLVATALARNAPTAAVPTYLAAWALAALIAVIRSPETAPAIRATTLFDPAPAAPPR
jgi:MHS family proline/betaine transporter-like MFS transporter